MVVSCAALACLLCGPILIRAQTKDKWERVYTGEESVIEINASNLKFEPDYILRAQFRTILSHPETLPGTSGAKYKTRLEVLDFKMNQRQYRMFETTLLDTKGNELQSYSTSDLRKWRVIKEGGVTEKLFNAVSALPPFGRWKVVEYRLAERTSNQTAPSELDDLIGVRVNLQFSRVEVGSNVCTFPAFVDSNPGLIRELEIDMTPLGIQGKSVDMTTIKCERGGWQPPYSLLVRVRDGEMLMLWKGVFLVLKR